MNIGRNDPCPCGSGKKYKKCCQNILATQTAAQITQPKVSIPTSTEIIQLVHLFNSGHYTALEYLARELLERNPDSGLVWKALGASLKAQNKEALFELQKAVELLADDAEAHSNLGTALKDIGRIDEAMASYHLALKFKPDYAEAHSNLGTALQDLGRLDEAVASYHRAVKIKPDFAEAHYNLGNALKDLRRLDEAVASYHRAVKIKPDFAEAHYNLGNALKDLGCLDEALDSYHRAVKFKPDFAEAHYNLGAALQALGRLDEAVSSYDLALKFKFDYAEAHNNLGTTLKDLGRLDESVESYHRAVKFKPDYAEAHSNLGNALKDLRRLDEAVASYHWALKLKPDLAEAHYNLGTALQDLSRLDEAVASYRQALKFKPEFAAAHNNLGNALKDLGRLDDAVASCSSALKFKPDYAEAHSNLGTALQDLGRLDEAVASYHRAVKFKPDFAEAHYNLGNALKDLGRLDEAVESYRLALKFKPDYAAAHNNLGIALKDLWRLDDAVTSCRLALKFKPDYAEAHNNLGWVLQDLGRLDEAVASYHRALKFKPDLSEAHSNLLFTHNYLLGQPAEALLSEAKRYGALVERQAHAYQEWPNLQEPKHCLRVGLVSGDFRTHPVGYFMEGVLGALAANASGRLEIIAYPSHFLSDALTERIKAYCHVWHSAVGLSDSQLAKQVRDDGIDILIDLSGHTAHNRLPMFAWKPAPIQVSWLGYFATTGVAAIDYLIADPWTLHESEEANFTEKIWRLPETRLCFTPPELNLDVSNLPALTKGQITFGCFNTMAKMNAGVVTVWSEILKRVPGSKLILKAKQFADQKVVNDVLVAYGNHGISQDRLILEGPSKREEYLSAYNRVDIALDPFPFPGGTTSVEGLWMGVPVLTLKGDRFISHQGEAIAHNVGLPNWIAEDVSDYVAKAERFGGDIQGLAKLRNGLRTQLLNSPLCDAPRFARHFEESMWGMWNEYKNGKDF